MFQKVNKIPEIITEPTPTKKLSETQLDEVVDGTSNIIVLCGLEKVHCHTQVWFLYFTTYSQLSI